VKRIYFDYGASTPVDKEIIDEIIPYFDKYFGNPSSIHSFGRKAFNAVEDSREKVAEILNANADEIIFTSGGTESDNLGIKGVAYMNKDKRGKKGSHIITSSIEHPAVLESCKHLEKQGFNVKYIPVDKYGLIKINDLEKAISNYTFLITIMFANNEIGTIEPIKEIGKIAKKYDIKFHTDAVQAICKTPIDVDELNIDLLSISSHKIYGPKGVGALYVRNGIKVKTLSHGGGHEKGMRSSTYNTPGIVGLGKACELGRKRLKKDMIHLRKLRDKLIKDTLKINECYLNGHPVKRLANNAHFRFTAIEGESLNMMLDEKGIATATGSACSSKKLQVSHVLTAIGLKPEEAHGSLRLTLGRENTEEDIAYINKTLPHIVENLREISPLWNK
jgi:cysteine desulfurase